MVDFTLSQEPPVQARYIRNFPALSFQDMQVLSESRVGVIGCGGLGGFVVEILSRIGLGELVIADFDILEASNLNRQLLANEHNLGTLKVMAAKKRLQEINSQTRVLTFDERFSDSNAASILEGCSAVIDALDDIPSRLILQKHCHLSGIPLIHGAIGGWCGQVMTILPDDIGLESLYEVEEESILDSPGNLVFLAAAIASLQCSEAIKILIRRGSTLQSHLLGIDFLQNEISCIPLIR